MPVHKGPTFDAREGDIDYPLEEVMFRWVHQARKIYVCFYGDRESSEPVPHDNRLFNDALLYGDEIGRLQYGLKERGGK
ncbi:hypothetical protein [Ralstonia chuxiongensis]